MKFQGICRSNLVKTLPGPHSINSSTLFSLSPWITSVHLTGLNICLINNSGMASTEEYGCASTFEKTGNWGREKEKFCKKTANSAAGSFIMREWKAPLTFKGTTIRAPLSLRGERTWVICEAGPEITICPGELKLARSI